MYMSKVILFLAVMATMFFGAPLRAQEQVWVQIEAHPSLRDADDRARAYSSVFYDVNGFQLASGWYALALGPYAPESGRARLDELRNQGLIPGDSFLADGGNFRQRFWPVGDGALPAPVEQAVLSPAPVDINASGESPAEARQSEAALSRTEREDLQSALQWFGFYTSAIDGAFGPGTRNSMASWQVANAQDPTGILTSRQRATLLADHRAAMEELGLLRVTEPEAGIIIDLPMAMIQFDHYEPPFVHYAEKDGSGVRVLLISQPGDRDTLYGLYDIMQTLSIVPLNGTRDRGERSFTLTGRSGALESYTYAELSDGLIKGFTLAWNPTDGDRMARVLEAMKSSFRSTGNRALDPSLTPMTEEQRVGLLSGLEVRRPALSRSGFYIDTAGNVLTTTDVLQNCSRITLDTGQEATVLLADPALGIAVLKPGAALAAPAYASLQTQAGRLRSEIAVAGYSYEDTLSAPSLTFGTLEDLRGLAGEPGLNRLAISVLPGDAGGPVFDSTGAVLGMLLPRTTEGGRVLPAGVNFAASAAAIDTRLAEAGIAVTSSLRQGAMPPEDLTGLANSMTVLVSCWN